MDREHDFVAALRNYPDKQADEQAFVQASIDEARLPARVAARMWLNGDAQISLNAVSYLAGVEDLAIAPLLEAPVPADPDKASRALDLLVEAELGLRAKLLKRINQLLDDKRVIPPLRTLGPKPEQKPDERRVCDEAYVAMRRVVHFGESAWDQLSGAREFYRSSEGARDAAIAKARLTKEWRHALAGPGAPDEDTPPPRRLPPRR